MPSLTREARDELLGPVSPCPVCHCAKIRHYCRSCDEFFLTCECPAILGFAQAAHGTHRVYLWTPAGVQAIPDFDTL
jgi:hypothetical protein